MTVADLVNRIRAGERRAIASLIRDLDDDRPGARDVLQALRTARDSSSDAEPPPRSIIAGITGGPGAGKSTLVDALVARWRGDNQRVGVVAVDPSSLHGGGAVLGDRIRMQRHAVDPGVFIRSVASRGAAGGLSRSTMDVATVLGASGFSHVLIETVGVGQAEVDVAAAADVTVLVMTPGLGDQVQMLKAGILEIADVLALNKSDRPDAAVTLRDLEAMLSLRHVSVGHPDAPVLTAPVIVPIVQTVATTGQGVAELAAVIQSVATSTRVSDPQRRRRRAEARIRAIATSRAEDAARAALGPGGKAASLVDDVMALRMDPETAAGVLMARLREGY